MKILAFSGSTRSATFDSANQNPFARGSFNSALLAAFMAAAPEGVTVEHVEFDGLPFFNQELEGNFPQAVTDLKAKIRAADGIVVSTPEYNRSFPGFLKNMIDWTSRPYGDNAWDKKPVYIMGASGAATGTLGAQNALKPVFLYLNARIMGQPEIYLNLAHTKFDAEGKLTDEDVKAVIAKVWAAFVEFVG